jgi:hypothetical protein
VASTWIAPGASEAEAAAGMTAQGETRTAAIPGPWAERSAGPRVAPSKSPDATGGEPLAQAGGRRTGSEGPLGPPGEPMPGEATTGDARAAACVSARRLPAIVVVKVAKEESEASPSMAREPGTLTVGGIARVPCSQAVKGRLRNALAGRYASARMNWRACSPAAAKASAIPAISSRRSPRARCQFQYLGGPFGCWV